MSFTYQAPKQLDDATFNFLTAFSNMFQSIGHLSIPEQRATIKEMFQIPESELETIAKVENCTIEGRHGPIPIRIFSPQNEGTLPVIVFFHRGGWVYGCNDECEVICRRIANASNAIVIAVEYRLSPEHKFPIPLDDCYDATKWAIQNASSFSGNPQKVIVSGESAGGNLAAAVALKARDTHEFNLAGQLLLYPLLTSDLVKDYYDESPDKFLLSYENMQFFWSAYLPSTEAYEDAYASPLKNTNLSELPPAFIVTAEHDALKHEGEKYAKALRASGVDTQIKCYENVIHGFLDLPLAEPVKKDALKDIVQWINKV